MKYINANDVLPEELLSMVQKYYQGGYLYIPKENYCEVKRQTDYKIELEKRNQHIYLRHLEGRTNGQLGNIYHLSESSIRRIILKEKVRYRKMKEMIEEILSSWGIENKQLLQIYPSAWEINHTYVIKIYDNKNQLERNIRIFDICYFLTGLLAEETDDAFTKNEWLENVKSVIAGYESISSLSEKEKSAIPCVMECIEILFAAYFISMQDTKHANDAYNIFHFIQNCESDILNTI